MSEIVIPRPQIVIPGVTFPRLPKWARPWERTPEKEDAVVAATTITSLGVGTSTTNPATTVTATSTGAVNAGETCFAAISYGSTTTSSTTVTGATWGTGRTMTQDVVSARPSAHNCWLFRLETAVTIPTSQAVTFTFGGTTAAGAVLEIFKATNLSSSTGPDGWSTQNGLSGTPTSPSSALADIVDEMLGIVLVAVASTAVPSAPSSPYTQIGTNTASGTRANSLGMGYVDQGPSSTLPICNWTVTSAQWCSMTVSYVIAGAAAPTARPRQNVMSQALMRAATR